MNDAKNKNWQKEESRVVSDIVDDIERKAPRLIMIESWGYRDGWSLYDCLIGNGFVERALLDDYEPEGFLNGFAIWRRKPGDRKVLLK
jgi:hypothetical protein